MWIAKVFLRVSAVAILAVNVGLMGGCGSAASVSSAPPSSTATQPQIASVTNFGDSITCGYYAAPADGSNNVYSMEGYAGLLNATIASPAQNRCRSGDQAADMARLWVYPNAVPTLGARQLYTVLIGTNDANICGASAGCLANYSQALGASLAWLAMPASDKVLASSMTGGTGAWSPDTALPMGMATTVSGSSLAVTVNQAVANRSLYVAFRAGDPAVMNGGVATLSVDGKAVASLNAAGKNGHLIQTQNGVLDTVFLVSVPLGAVGAHKVTVTMTSADGTFFSLLWMGTPSGSYASVDGAPRVVIGGVTVSTSATLDQVIPSYNSVVTQTVAAMVADGMNIKIAPTATALDTATDFADFLHPNNAGHAKLAAAFSSAF